MNFLEIQNVSKKYGVQSVLDDVSLSIPKGSIFGLLGPNGAGKTSLIRIITQITGPDSGQILFKGEKLSEIHSNQVGYLPEERGLYKKMKVGDQLLYLAQLKGLSKNDAKEKLKVWIRKFEIQTWLEKTIEDLSKGMQQKIQFIATVVHEPELIILDEPFTGFDPLNANQLRNEILLLKSKGATIIFSTHRMETVEELCDYIALIDKAKIVLEGNSREIRNKAKTNIYKIEVTGILGTLPENFQLLEQRPVDNGIYAEIKILTGNQNDLIRFLSEKVAIHAFNEKVPSMNDIFISSVSSNN